MTDYTADQWKTVAARLDALTPGEVDSITGLQTRDDEGWQALVTRVRDDVSEAAREGRLADGEESDVSWEIADSLVPVYTRERFRELYVIGAAYHHDIDDAGSLPTTVSDVVGVILFEVYRAAVDELIEWAHGQMDDDDETTEEI